MSGSFTDTESLHRVFRVYFRRLVNGQADGEVLMLSDLYVRCCVFVLFLHMCIL